MVVENLGLVRHITNSLVNRKHFLYEEAYNEGVLGLVVAADRFNPELNVPFSAYARYWIRAYVILYLKKNRYSGYVSVEMEGNFPDPEEIYLRNEEMGILLPALDSVVRESTPQQIYLLDRRILSDEPETLQSIADKWKMSKQRVNQIEAKIINKIRKEVLRD